MSIIKVSNLYKSFNVKTKEEGFRGSVKSIFAPNYRKIDAVNNISLEVQQGEILAFIGPNGAGKSTTIKMMTGILNPTSGNIEVLGLNPITQRKKLSCNIGTVFGQKSQLWFHLPPIDSFKLLGSIYEIDKNTLNKRIKYLTEIFEIEELMDIPVRKLSLGQRIRCEIAASMLHKPEIIFLDEPTIGLDVVVKQKIRELILRLNSDEKTTIFLTSHDAGDIEQLCKRAIIINHGQIVLNQSIRSLKYNYLNKKNISIKYNDNIQIPEGEFNILKLKDNKLKVEVDTSKADIETAITKLISYGKINDIIISEPPLEEIIASIYKEKREEVSYESSS